MFILHLPDRETAMLLLYYAKRGAESHTTSLIEAPRIAKKADELIQQIKERFE